MEDGTRRRKGRKEEEERGIGTTHGFRPEDGREGGREGTGLDASSFFA